MTHLRLARIVSLFVLVFCIANSASAATRNWNALSGDWSTSSNWSNGNIPSNGDDAFIVNSDGVSRTVTYDYSGPAITLNSLTLDLAGGTGSATNTLFMPNAFSLSANSATVGLTGNGAINNVTASNTFQNLFLGYYFGSTGAYALGDQASLSTTYDYIGYGGDGKFTQNNGDHTATYMDIAENSGSSGVYNLVSGVLTSTIQTVGVHGNATFNHTGGTNSVQNLAIGESNSATGVYNLSGAGILNANFINIGDFGTGTFNQTGGTNTVTGYLDGLEIGVYGHGSYNLSGTGKLSVTHDEIIGVENGSSGIFTQTGGSHTIGDDGLILGLTIGSSGDYFLSGGTVSAPAVHIGGLSIASGTGTFSVSGTGSLNVAGTIEVFNTPGSSITFSGGSITTGALQLDGGSSQFNWTGGALNITGSNALVIGPTGTLGNTTLTTGKSLSVSYGAIIQGMLTVDGGSFSGALNNSGFFNVNSGSVILGFSTNTGEINLGGSQAIISGLPNVGILSSTGLLHGEGTLLLPYVNSGEIRAENGKRLFFAVPCGTNFGQITLQGGTAEFLQALTNGTNGQIVGRGMLKIGGTGLTNQGNIAFSAGITDVFGLVNNNTSSASRGISLAGNANVTFWNDVANTSGFFKVNGGSSATFFGAFSGNGITGSGNVDFESDINPGFSPASVTFGGNVNLGAVSRLNIELGGTTASSQFDQVHVTGQLALDGILNISLINGFHPQSGQSFHILDWGSLNGEFADILTPLGNHIVWDNSQLYILGNLSIVATYYAGDFNRDGHVDAADILAGQNALADLSGFESQYGLSPANASLVDDLNGDGVFNAADVQFLLTAIKNGNGSANPVPEPSTLALLTVGSLLGLAALRKNRR